MKQFISILLILVVAASLSIALILLKPEAEKKQVTQPVTEVTVIEVTPETVQLTIQSQGTVLPVTETDISLQVSGRSLKYPNASGKAVLSPRAPPSSVSKKKIMRPPLRSVGQNSHRHGSPSPQKKHWPTRHGSTGRPSEGENPVT